MDLVKLITDKVKEVETSGKLNEIIEKNVLKCLEDVVRDSFQWSGEAKKSIEEALKEKLNINVDNVKIPQYQKLVSEIVNNKLNGTIVEDLRVDIEDAVNKVTEVLEKKEWKLSEIIAKFIETLDKSYDGDMDDLYGECTLHVDNDGKFCHVRFDKLSDRETYRCENTLFIYRGKLSSCSINEKPLSPFVTDYMDDFQEFMFKLYCNNVSIIIDEHDCELNYYREDYD